MGRITFSLSVSLDGFVATPDGSLDWVHVDEELHRYFNDEARDADVFVYGRRMYELMAAYWPTADTDPGATPAMREFAAIWGPKPKLVCSRTLDRVDWNSTLVGGGALDEIERLRAQPGTSVGVGGPTLAAGLIERGLVDEYRLFVQPVILGAGIPYFPPLAAPLALTHLETRAFDGGVVLLRYASASAQRST